MHAIENGLNSDDDDDKQEKKKPQQNMKLEGIFLAKTVILAFQLKQ